MLLLPRTSLFTIAVSGMALLFTPTPSEAEPPAPIWTGAYVGGAAGYQLGKFDSSEGDLDLNGFSGGVFAGYNFQVGSTVFGLEASYNAQSVDDSQTEDDGLTTDTKKLQANDVVMLKARAGVPVGSMLIYATGGVGWAKTELGLTVVDHGGAGTGSAKFSDWAFGYVAGGGIELPISKSLKLRGEAIYQSYSVDFDATSIGGEKASFDYDTTLIQAGLSYSFN